MPVNADGEFLIEGVHNLSHPNNMANSLRVNGPDRVCGFRELVMVIVHPTCSSL
jgi:hypothetical protein